MLAGIVIVGWTGERVSRWTGLAVTAAVESTVRIGTGVTGLGDGDGVTLPVLEEQAANNKNTARVANPRSDLFNTLLKFKRPQNSRTQAGKADISTLPAYEIIPSQRYRV